MACSSSCATQDHATFGECLRAKNFQVADIQAHDRNQRMHKQLDAYVDARRAGIQPDGIQKRHVDRALKVTEATGKPYRGDQAFTPSEG